MISAGCVWVIGKNMDHKQGVIINVINSIRLIQRILLKKNLRKIKKNQLLTNIFFILKDLIIIIKPWRRLLKM